MVRRFTVNRNYYYLPIVSVRNNSDDLYMVSSGVYCEKIFTTLRRKKQANTGRIPKNMIGLMIV